MSHELAAWARDHANPKFFLSSRRLLRSRHSDLGLNNLIDFSQNFFSHATHFYCHIQQGVSIAIGNA